jgi:hypothetical protein
MRAAENEVKLCNWLLDIGRGLDDGKPSDEVKIPKENQSKSLSELLHFCFPKEVFVKPLEHSSAFCDAALLCPRVEDVKSINDMALQLLHGDATRIDSLDSPLPGHSGPQTRYDPFRADLTMEAIHREEPSSLPPHTLYLKVNSIYKICTTKTSVFVFRLELPSCLYEISTSTKDSAMGPGCKCRRLPNTICCAKY